MFTGYIMLNIKLEEAVKILLHFERITFLFEVLNIGSYALLHHCKTDFT